MLLEAGVWLAGWLLLEESGEHLAGWLAPCVHTLGYSVGRLHGVATV
eukprot:COSAG02_NODE_22804_length_739_cov_6.717187_2_plen_47_part_00